MHGVFYSALGAVEVISEGSGPEDGVFEFGDRGAFEIRMILETGWRLFVSFVSDAKVEFNWDSKIFGNTDEGGLAQFDTALNRFYFVTPTVSGSMPPEGGFSIVKIIAGSSPPNWKIRALQITAIC